MTDEQSHKVLTLESVESEAPSLFEISALHEKNARLSLDQDECFLQETFRGLTDGIAKIIQCDAIGFIDTNALRKEHIFSLTLSTEVTDRFLESFRKKLIAEYSSQRGLCPPFNDYQMLTIHTPRHDGCAENISCISYRPIYSCGELQGLIAVASFHKDSFSVDEELFLTQTSEVLSSVAHRLAAVRESAWRDALTGLFNRRGLDAELFRAWMDARRENQPIGVALVDLDQFKVVNDTYGHQVGDLVLQEFTEQIQRVARTSDIIARYGGDEILIILPRSDITQCLRFSERLREGVENFVFSSNTGQAIKLTASVGIASALPGAESKDTKEHLLQRADVGLLAAKRQGRNRVCLDEKKNSEQKNKGVQRKELHNGCVLIIDDEEMILKMLSSALERSGYETLCAETAEEALTLLRKNVNRIDAIVVDINLPDKNGLELIAEFRLIDDSINTIVVTGESSIDNAIRALRRGAYDFLEKPVKIAQFNTVVQHAVEYRRLRQENTRYHDHLEELVHEKSAELVKALHELEHAHTFTLEAMVSLLDARERSTGEHSVRTSRMMVRLAEEMGYPKDEIKDFAQGALLHDIGKICIPDSILLKPGKLDAQETKIMRTHPEVGYKLLYECVYLRTAAEIVYQHQECYDGSGFPQQLAGQDICDGARLFGVVDAYDAMRSDRVYRKGISEQAAREEIIKCSGSQFDPQVVKAFKLCQSDWEKIGHWADYNEAQADDRKSTI